MCSDTESIRVCVHGVKKNTFIKFANYLHCLYSQQPDDVTQANAGSPIMSFHTYTSAPEHI